MYLHQCPERGKILRKASIITAVVMALVTTACGGDKEVATTEAAEVATTEAAEVATTEAAEVATTEAAAASTMAPVETTTTAAAAAPVPAREGTIKVTLLNWEFSPVASAVTSGEPIVVDLENRSSHPHTWALLTAGTQWATWEDFDLEQILAATQGIPADGFETLEFIAPEPGTYQVVCTVRGHIQRGMVGELVVEG
jgi:plastocyanin